MLLMVDLDELAGAIGADNAEGTWYLDTLSSTVVLVADYVMELALKRVNLPPDAPGDLHLQYKTATDVLYDEQDRFLKIPGRLDVIEWDIMRRFSLQQEPNIAERLVESISGTSAFRGFQAQLRKYKLIDQWSQFRDAALRKVAAEWCEQHGITYE